MNRKMTKSQRDVLEQAKVIYERDQRPQWLHGRLFVGEFGWFFPERHETCEVYAYPQTCKSLCALGLLEYKTVSYLRKNGSWYPENAYRITPDGVAVLIARSE